jgi:ABC-type bacteriocin/lantibiotic exporter with double-glycine peptidase domain
MGNRGKETTMSLANEWRNSVNNSFDFVLNCFVFYFRINNLSTRYRENLELVLKDVTVNIQPGEKVNENSNFKFNNYYNYI